MSNSEDLFKHAQKIIPGGVNSPVRAFKAVGGNPVFFKKAKGAYLYDEDNNSYIDYVGSWGPMILGHAHPEVIQAVQQAAESGLSFGAPTAIEITMAEKVCQLMPSIESVRMVSSGTEATMSAIRLARGYTKRDKILKFEGCYHGHADSLLVKAGSGALTFGEPTSPGVPITFAQHTLTATFNDLDSVKEIFAAVGDEIAAIIVEPVAGNMNCIPPTSGFLEGLRTVCDQHGSILIFDEVMSGFRVALGGAQAIYKVKPDLTTLGKVIGGGMPVGAFGGKRIIMDHLSPVGPVYQAGTLSGNPIAMAAGLKTLTLLEQPNFFENLSAKADALCQGLRQAANAAGISLTTNQLGGMFGFFLSDEEKITQFDQVTQCDEAKFSQFYHSMLAQGIYLAPSLYEAGFISAAHTQSDLDQTCTAAEKAFQLLQP